LAAGGKAPISRLASDSGERSPVWARRTSLSSSRELAAEIAEIASDTKPAKTSGESVVTSTGSKDLFGALTRAILSGKGLDLVERVHDPKGFTQTW